MPDSALVATILSSVWNVVVGWTLLSCLAAGAWCVYRTPGRAERLALEDARAVAVWHSLEPRTGLRNAA